jgi:hypothetical protein
MHNRHAWTQRSEEGAKREVRVVKRGGTWRFQARTAGQEEWTYYDEAPLDDLAEFREVLLRKYQRRRAAYEDVLWAEREMARLKELL